MRVLSFDSLRSALPCAPSGEGADRLLANEFERRFVRAQVFTDDVSKSVVTASALKLRLVRALGVHVSKQHAETAKHVFEVLDPLHVVHDLLPVVCR